MQQWYNANNDPKFPYNANTEHRETESRSKLEELQRDREPQELAPTTRRGLKDATLMAVDNPHKKAAGEGLG